MEIKEQNENRLVIENSLASFLFTPQTMISGIFLIFYLLAIFADPKKREVIPFLIVVAIVGIVIWSLIVGGMIFNCIFDRETETVLAQTRVPWQLFISHNRKIHFQDVKSLLFKKSGRDNPKLFLQLESASIRFAGEGDSKVAEAIADFLGIPLYIELDNERVTRLPKALTDDDVTVTVTFCSKCGAPLPKIYPGQKNVKCTHCGMTMFLEWNEKLTSFKSSYENE